MKSLLLKLCLFVSLFVIVDTRPAVNLIIDSTRKPVNIKCPNVVPGIRADATTTTVNDVSSKVQVTFNCLLYFNAYEKEHSNVRYHVSMIPLFNSSIVGCPQLDGCLSLFLRHIPPHDFVEVRIKSEVPCLYKNLAFQYELRELSKLIDNGFVDVLIGQKPPSPGYLRFKRTSNVLFIEGNVVPVCKPDLQSVVYYMQHEATTQNCTQSSETACKLFEDKNIISCQVNNTCAPESPCDVLYSAYVYGVNKFKMHSDQSPRFSNMLALASKTSLSTKVTNKTLNSFTVSFQKPVNCVSSLSHFQYKVSYAKVAKKQEEQISLIDKSCKIGLNCTIKLVGLTPNTHYNICVAYQAYFDYTSEYSKPYCINSSTGQLPCKTPVIHNVTPVTTNEKIWNAVVTWIPLDTECWHDNNLQYYIVKLHQQSDSKKIFQRKLSMNNTDIVITGLSYTEEYTLTVVSCNYYGCMPGINYRLAVTYNQQNDNVGPSSTQTITETILICFLSVLFLAVSSILYFILKKRKQFQRFQRRLRTDDIQLVTQLENTETPIETTTNTQPLLPQKKVTIVHKIPEHSTLV